MISGPPFPRSVNDLTPSTLTAALDTQVASFSFERIGADRGMLGEIYRLVPVYESPGAGPAALIAKFSVAREEALAGALRAGFYERELRCYDELLAETDVNRPAFHGAWYDPDTAHFLLLQELIEADTSIDQVVGLDAGLVELVLQQVAKLHHRWWDDPKLAGLAWLPAVDGERRVTNLTSLAERGWQPMCELLGDELTPAEQALGAEFPEHLHASLNQVASFETTLVHSDLRTDNLLFAPDHSSVALIDWQGVSTGPPGFDIAYLLVHSMTVTERRRHEHRLLGFYRDELARLGTDLDADTLAASYRASLLYGLVIACAMPLISDPSEPRVATLATTMARRSLEALRDADQLWVQ